MFRWNMKNFYYNSFFGISNIVLSDTLSDEEFSFFCTSVLSYSLSQTCLSSLLEPCHMPTIHQGIPSPTPPYTFWLSLFFIWIQDSLQDLVFGILINRMENSPTMRSHGQRKGNWQRKDFTYMFAKCLFAISCIFLLTKSSMMSDVVLPLGCQLSYSHPSIWSSTFVDHSIETWNEG